MDFRGTGSFILSAWPTKNSPWEPYRIREGHIVIRAHTTSVVFWTKSAGVITHIRTHNETMLPEHILLNTCKKENIRGVGGNMLLLIHLLAGCPQDTLPAAAHTQGLFNDTHVKYRADHCGGYGCCGTYA